MNLLRKIKTACGSILALMAVLVGGQAVRAADDFLQAIQPRDWQFPRDHGRHDGFRTEWWYTTGNVQTPDHRPFGFQVTFFRTSIAPNAIHRGSRWATNDLYFAHAHVSDIQAKRYLMGDQTSRAREGLAMASDHDLDVYMPGWSAKQTPDGIIHLRAVSSRFSIDLDCSTVRGPIFQGPGGVSQKGRDAGQASYYYSLTRLATKGTLTVDSKAFPVTGLSWMDHEFSSNQLSHGQVGWDWLSLQMNDGSDLMLYRMRNPEGTADFAFGTEVTPDGQTRYIPGDAISLTGSRGWKSPISGAVYPQRWRVEVKGHQPFMLQTRYEDQEMRSEQSTRITYYEGAAEALDEAGRNIGQGYLEMTGYAKSLAGSF